MRMFRFLSAFAILALPFLGQCKEGYFSSYNDPYSFMPNYARSFPSFVGTKLPKAISNRQPLVQLHKLDNEDISWANAAERGLHTDKELELRSLPLPELSTMFNQPVTTSELLASSQQQQQLALMPFSSNRTPSSPFVTPQPGDYSNPFFRPVYARPPPPKRTHSASKINTCDCPCKCDSVVTISPQSVQTTKDRGTTKPASEPITTKQPPEPEASFNGLLPVSAKLTTFDATKSPKTSVADLVLQAFNSTRVSANTVATANDSDQDNDEELRKSMDEEKPEKINGPLEGESLSVRVMQQVVPTTISPVPTTISTTVRTVMDMVVTPTPHSLKNDREGKKALDLSYLTKPVNLHGSDKRTNRRFNTLLDLSLRRGAN